MVSFGSKAQQQALDALRSAVDLELGPISFGRTDEWNWRRKAPWRIDEIDLVVKGGTSKHILPSFRVLLPRTRPSEFGDDYHHIAQVNVARLLRPSSGPDFDISVPASGFGKERFVRSVVLDIKAALSWFEQFATPEVAKASLGKFLKPGCPAYLDAEQYLDSLLKL